MLMKKTEGYSAYLLKLIKETIYYFTTFIVISYLFIRVRFILFYNDGEIGSSFILFMIISFGIYIFPVWFWAKHIHKKSASAGSIQLQLLLFFLLGIAR